MNDTSTTAMIRHTAPAPLATMQPQTIDEAMGLAKMLAGSDMVPDAYRNKPANILIAIMRGRELGWGAMQSMSLVHVVKGKVVLSADAMVGLVKRHPECVFFHLVRSTAEAACYQTQRAGEPSATEMEFTIQDAQRAGLLSSGTWKAYPAAMLRARCSAALARAVYPDVLAGVYETDEGREIARDRTTTATQARPASPRPASASTTSSTAATIDVVPDDMPSFDDDPEGPAGVEVPPAPPREPPTAATIAARIDAATDVPECRLLRAELATLPGVPPEALPGLHAALATRCAAACAAEIAACGDQRAIGEVGAMVKDVAASGEIGAEAKEALRKTLIARSQAIAAAKGATP